MASQSSASQGAGVPEMQCLAWKEVCSAAGGGCAFAPEDCAISVPRAHEVHFQPVAMGEGELQRNYLCLRESDGGAAAVYGDGDFMRAMGLCAVEPMDALVTEDQARRFDAAATPQDAPQNLGAMCAPGAIPVLNADRTVECVLPGARRG